MINLIFLEINNRGSYIFKNSLYFKSKGSAKKYISKFYESNELKNLERRDSEIGNNRTYFYESDITNFGQIKFININFTEI